MIASDMLLSSIFDLFKFKRKLWFVCNAIKIYCKFGNFRVTFISRIFHFRIISEVLNSQGSVHVFYKVYSDLARTLNLRDNQFANISKN